MFVENLKSEIKRENFQILWDKAKEPLEVTPKGLPSGRFEVVKRATTRNGVTRQEVSRGVFVLDQKTGAACLYFQPKVYVEIGNDGEKTISPASDAHFIRTTKIEETKDAGEKVKVTLAKGQKLDATKNVYSIEFDKVKDGYTQKIINSIGNLVDESINPGFEEAFNNISRVYVERGKDEDDFRIVSEGEELEPVDETKSEPIPEPEPTPEPVDEPELEPIPEPEPTPEPVEELEPEPTSESYRLIQMSAKSKLLGNKDTKDAYLVVGPHPNAAKAARGKKAMYIVEGLTESAVADLKTSEEILSQGAKVVRRVRCDKNGEIKIEYYKNKDKLALFKKKAELAHSDKPQELKAWADSFGVGDKGFDNEKVLTVRPSYKTRRVVPLVLATVAAVAAIAGVGAKHVIDANEQARLNEEQTKLEQELEEQQKAEDYQAAWDSVPDESKLAEIYGAEQVVDRTSQIGTTLLNYNTVGNTVSVSVGNIYHIVNEPIDIYQQQKLVEYDGQQIGADKYDYTLPTISGAFEELGTQVAQEASDNGVIVATRADSNSSADINYIYGAVDPLSPTSALSDETAMREYLTELYSDVYSDTTVDEIVSAAMSSYERGFAEKATELSIENPDLIINEGDRPVVDYNDPQIQSAVASAISKLSTNGKKYSAEEINIAYGSYKEQMIYANTTDGKYLFAIDLTNGGKDISEIDSTADMVEKIQNVDNCKESAQLDFIVRNLNVGKVLDYYKNSYASENSVTNPQIYISDYIVLEQSDDNSNKFEISPTITIVSNNGGKIEESDLSTVRVNAGGKSSISEMVAVSVFGDAVVDQFPYYETVSRDSNNKVYEDNDLIVDDATTSLTVDYSTNTTAQSTSLTGKTGNNHNKEKTL